MYKNIKKVKLKRELKQKQRLYFVPYVLEVAKIPPTKIKTDVLLS